MNIVNDVNDSSQEMDEKSSSFSSANNQQRSLYTAILKMIGAFVCLGIGVLTWILMAEVLQGMFKKYSKPYFLAYWIHSFYALLYVGWKVWREFPGNLKCNMSGDGALHWKKVLWSSAIIGVVGLVSGYFWYLSLTRTSVPANTSIYQSCVAFVFILSVPILRERVTFVKVLAVMFAIGGVALISIFSEKDSKKNGQDSNNNSTTTSTTGQDNNTPTNTPMGFVYLVISTVLYAVVEVLFKKWASAKNDTSPVCNSFRAVGMMGIHSLLWMWVPLIVLHYTRIEPFEWPTLDIFKLMCLNALMDVIFNGAVFLCIALSSPLFASVGVVTAIPLSIVVDFVVKKRISSMYQVYLGMGLIVIGFTGFCVSEFIATKREHKTAQNQMLNKKQSIQQGGIVVRTDVPPVYEEDENEPLLVKNRQKIKRTFQLILTDYII